MGAVSQNSEDIIPDYYQVSDSTKPAYINKYNKQISEKKIRTSFEAGTTIASFTGTGTCFSTYVSPFMSYKVNNRFTLDVGFRFSQGNMAHSYSPLYGEQLLPFAGSLNEKLVFTRGKYDINDRLTVYGTAAYGIATFKQNSAAIISDNQLKEFSFGAEYKLGENSTIGIEIRHVEGNLPGSFFNNDQFPLRSAGIH